jgi:hypothetical protein
MQKEVNRDFLEAVMYRSSDFDNIARMKVSHPQCEEAIFHHLPKLQQQFLPLQ